MCLQVVEDLFDMCQLLLHAKPTGTGVVGCEGLGVEGGDGAGVVIREGHGVGVGA